MANNDYVNKVEYGNETLIDITSTTAEEGDVIEGKSFFLKSGAPATGTLGDATTSAHGLMSAIDKNKLDNIISIDPYETINTPSSVITVDDAIDNASMGVKIAVEPVQDLHGYSNPWVGGAGKNKLNMTLEGIKSANTTGTWNGNVYTVNSMTVTVNTDSDGNVTGFVFNGQPSANTWFTFRKFDSGEISVDGAVKMGGYMSATGDVSTKWGFQLYFKNNNGSNIIASATSNSYVAVTNTVTSGDTSANYMALVVRSTGSPSNLVVKPMIVASAETNYDFAPYTNLCPISGWDKAEVTRTGKNLATTEVEKRGYTIFSTGEGQNSTTTNYIITKPILLAQGKSYRESYTRISGTDPLRVGYYDSNLNFINRENFMSSGTALTVPSSAKYLKLSYKVVDAEMKDFQIEEGSTATTYEPFGTVYTIPFRSTMYGGYITVGKDGEVVATATSAMIVLDGSSTVVHNNSYPGNFGVKLASNTYVYYGEGHDSVDYCNEYKVGTYQGTSSRPNGKIDFFDGNFAGTNGSWIAWKDERYTSTTNMSAFLAQSPIQAVLDLATPVTVRLNPCTIRSLLGTNNLWADTGDIQQLIYTKLTSGLMSSEDKSKLDNIISVYPYVTLDTPTDIVKIENATAATVKEIDIAIAPLQDLHGYDHPWVAGAGKNLFPLPTVATEKSGVTLEPTEDGEIWIHGTPSIATGSIYFPFPQLSSVLVGQTATISINEKIVGVGVDCNVSGGGLTLSMAESIATKTTTVSSILGVSAINVRYDVGNINKKFKIQVEIGSSATSFVPYTNICPITGWEKAEVINKGNNLISLGTQLNGYAGSTTFTTESTAKGYYFKTADLPNNVIFNATNGNRAYVSYYNSVPASGVAVAKSDQSSQTLPRAITIDKSYPYVHFQFSFAQTATDFEVCDGTITVFSFPQSCGTVYGGTLSVNQDGTGSLVVDKYCYTLPDITAFLGTSSTGYKYVKYTMTLPNGGYVPYVDNPSAIRFEKIPSVSYSTRGPKWSGYISSADGIIVFADTDTTVSEFNSIMAGSKVVCDCTKYTYSLTEQEVISLLSGQNTVYADCGDIQKLIYVKETSGLLSASDKNKLDNIQEGAAVKNVQINGTSILSNNIANIPIASWNTLGLVKANADYGLGILSDGNAGIIATMKADTSLIKTGTNIYKPIVPYNQHEATFYGLAKAAGDSTQAASTNAVGVYTANAKTKIGEMLGYDSREWELIREDTFTNAESADHIITVDKDGLPFDLTDVVFLFETPKSSTIASAKGNYGQVWFYYGTGNGDYFSPEPGAWTQAVDTAAHGFAVKITQEPGGLFTCMETASTTSTNSASWRSRFVGGLTGVAQGVRKLTYTRHFSKINIRGVTGIGHYILIGKRTPA